MTYFMTFQVTHVLAGDDAGPAKLAKAEELGIPVINEDQFLKLITDLSNKNSSSNKEVKSNAKEGSRNKSKEDLKSREKSDSKSKDKGKEKHSKSADKSAPVSEDKMKAFEEKIKKNFYSKTKERPLVIDSSPERDSQEIEMNRVAELKTKGDVNGKQSVSTSSSVGKFHGFKIPTVEK